MARIQEHTFDRNGKALATPRLVANVMVGEDHRIIIQLHQLTFATQTATELAEEILRSVAQAEAANEAFAQAEYNRVMEALDGFDY